MPSLLKPRGLSGVGGSKTGLTGLSYRSTNLKIHQLTKQRRLAIPAVLRSMGMCQDLNGGWVGEQLVPHHTD